MSMQTSVFFLVTAALLVVCVQGMTGKLKQSLTQIRCPDTAEVLITQAFFWGRPAISDRCTKHCAPINGSLSPSVCKKGHRERCKASFTNQELNDAYWTLDSGSRAKVYQTAKYFDKLGQHTIGYKCLNKGKLKQSLIQIRCPDTAEVLITQAFFWGRTAISDRCTKHCAPINGSLSPLVCKKGHRERCKASFTNQELNDAYWALDSGSRAKVDRTAKYFDELGQHTIGYKCLNKGPEVVDPCAHEQSAQWRGQKFTSILVDPQRLSSQQQCIKVCTLKPAGHFRLRLHFVLKEEEKQKDRNSLEYQFVSRLGKTHVQNSWTPLNNITHLLIGVEGLKIRFNLRDLSAVTRLWISFVGEPNEFSFSCQSNATHQFPGETDSDENILVWTYIPAAVGGCIGLVVIVTLTAVVLIRYRRSGRVTGNISDKGRSSGPDKPRGNMSGRSVQSDEGLYIELDDTVHVYHNEAVPMTPNTLPKARITAGGDKTHTSLGEYEGTSSEAGGQTCGHGAEGSSTLHSHASTDSEDYSKPQIYMNAPEDYHPYTNLKSSSQRQDTLSTIYSEAYQYGVPEIKSSS